MASRCQFFLKKAGTKFRTLRILYSRCCIMNRCTRVPRQLSSYSSGTAVWTMVLTQNYQKQIIVKLSVCAHTHSVQFYTVDIQYVILTCFVLFCFVSFFNCKQLAILGPSTPRRLLAWRTSLLWLAQCRPGHLHFDAWRTYILLSIILCGHIIQSCSIS